MHDLFTFLEKAPEMDFIVDVYRGKIAKRSGVHYLNHIVEGAALLWKHYGPENDPPILEFCLHPLFQGDDTVAKLNLDASPLCDLKPSTVFKCMEYRKTANAYTVKHRLKKASEIQLSPVKAVNQMLVADKVQNKKDYLAHIYMSKNQPPYQQENDRLLTYFDSWLRALKISEIEYQNLANFLHQQTPEINQFVRTLS